ncbi:MAG: MFS transporter [Deltaproteobacteria bacterium]|nr:MFS transporter [Deltaproteobacteria bacterium]
MPEKLVEPFLKKTFFLALGHLVIDLYPAFLPALLPLWIEKFQFSFTRASLLAMVMSFSASMTQPVFGYLSDKLGGRKTTIFGPVIGGLSLSFLGLAHSYSLLVILLILGGLGVASYHPEAAALTTSLSGRRKTLGMSIFMLGGNFGYGLGPFLILSIIIGLGLEWSFLACLPALGMAWLLYKYPPLVERGQSMSAPAGTKLSLTGNRRVIHFGVLLAVVVLRVTTILSLITFLPMIQKLRGFSLMAAASSFTVFMACGALGGLIGGYLSDRFGRKRIIIASFTIILPAFLAFLYWRGPSSFAILALLGFLFFLSEPACIVLAQEMAPRKARTVSGLIMGMSWGVAGLGVLGTGALADLMGIEGALRYLLLLPIGALILSFSLPRS